MLAQAVGPGAPSAATQTFPVYPPVPMYRSLSMWASLGGWFRAGVRRAAAYGVTGVTRITDTSRVLGLG